MTQVEQVTQFEQDVLEGLSEKQKRLPSKYFYDEAGDQLFRKIMHLDEYYLTGKEEEIFRTHCRDILDTMWEGKPFRIIELGAGDGSKTKILLKYFISQQVAFTYSPVDISANVLEILENTLKIEIPALHFEAFHGDYFEALSEMTARPEKDVIFFLGSNIGNFEEDTAVNFFSNLGNLLKPADQIFLGVDLKKDPIHILSAYHDQEGITKAFNLNLLSRINRELAGNFDITKFRHYPYYNPQTGECRSYLISKEKQDVSVAGKTISFRAWEAIFMEVSKKYDSAQLSALAERSGFREQASFYDSEKWFTDRVWIKE